ncbi:hypothetical protein J2T13_000191 [Paenibacillus sp. DS2015]|uniref:hypothetical protein n=1 Tax=Paenibacillus sp. DS2015 TaxID=3373917 RepID=UPI003D2214BE
MSIFTKVGAPSIPLADRIASDLIAHLDAWFSVPEVYDDALDAEIHRWYADILTNRQRKVWAPKDIPYFSPSSVGSCKRMLYMKQIKKPQDNANKPPYQGRWNQLGTTVGDLIQRNMLFAEKHYAAKVGQHPRFAFERNAYNEPMFEQFAPGLARVTHNGKTFALYGFCDGIMLYRTDDGEVLRVGLEIKSKQTTCSRTGDYSMKAAEDKHVKQVVCYSQMYNVDYYVILYVNCSKKNYVMTPEEYAKSPDIRAFGFEITDAMRSEVFDGFTEVLDAVESGIPPKLDIDNFTFNNFKRACSLSLTDEELADIQRQVSALQRSSLPDYKKRGPSEALAEIERIRAESTKEVAL